MAIRIQSFSSFSGRLKTGMFIGAKKIVKQYAKILSELRGKFAKS